VSEGIYITKRYPYKYQLTFLMLIFRMVKFYNQLVGIMKYQRHCLVIQTGTHVFVKIQKEM